MDINVHRFGFPAKRGLYYLQEKFKDIVFEVRNMYVYVCVYIYIYVCQCALEGCLVAYIICMYMCVYIIIYMRVFMDMCAYIIHTQPPTTQLPIPTHPNNNHITHNRWASPSRGGTTKSCPRLCSASRGSTASTSSARTS